MPRKSKLVYLAIWATGVFVLYLLHSNSNSPTIWSYERESLFTNHTIGNGQVMETALTSPIDNSSEEIACKFSRLDPFDQSIRQFIRHPKGFSCDRVQEFDMTFIDDEGYVRINLTEWAAANKKFEHGISCSCATFDRPLGTTQDDDIFVYGPDEILEPDYPLRMPGNNVDVFCSKNADNSTFYWNIHVHPTTCAQRDFQDLEKAPEDQLSVLMLVVESVSISALKRNLPLTHKYLTEKMGFYVFNGYNKVGDNTRPNMFPILTGKRILYEQPDMPSEVDDLRRFLDKGPELIWKRYADRNYSIVMNEDYSFATLFHYRSKGFHRKPADYYYRALWIAIDDMAEKLNSTKFCYGNFPKLHLQIDLTRRHLTAFQNKLQFIFSFFAELNHYDDYEIERGDESFVSFFRLLHEEKPELINRSVTIFMADHGHRYSQIRSTLVGSIEERQPMFLIRFPDWFYRKYPEIRRSLQINMQRLASPFDVHETLQDVVDMNYNGQQRPWDTRALSMLYPIPKNRTCQLAGIPEHFCTCVDHEVFDTTNQYSKAAADYLTKHLNIIVRNSTSWAKNGTRCHEWRWTRISRAERVGVSTKIRARVQYAEEWDKLVKENKVQLFKNHLAFGEKLRIAVHMEPKNAIFEAELVFTGNFESWGVLGDVSRLNAYGNQSWCVDHEVIRKYCVCE